MKGRKSTFALLKKYLKYLTATSTFAQEFRETDGKRKREDHPEPDFSHNTNGQIL